MGQKVSPIIFRLFKNNSYQNLFYSSLIRGKKKKIDYTHKLEYCLKFLTWITTLKKTLHLMSIYLNFKLLNNIEVNVILPYLQKTDELNSKVPTSENLIVLNFLYKDLVLYFKFVQSLKLKKMFSTFNKINNISFNFKIFKQPLFSSKFIFFYINLYFKNKFLTVKNIFHYIFFNLFVKIKSNKSAFKGIKVRVSGRLKGHERSKSESIKKGKLTVQTIENKIDFTSSTIPTKFGALGIKIWLFKY